MKDKHRCAVGPGTQVTRYRIPTDMKVCHFRNHYKFIIVGSQLTNEHPSESGDQSAMKYGKVNFINRADKEVKIFEVSGIGEPTVLSPNFISTFFLKSPKESATFRAIDPNSNEAYLLNDQPSLEIKLDQNPRVETEVQVTAPKTLATSASKKGTVVCFT